MTIFTPRGKVRCVRARNRFGSSHDPGDFNPGFVVSGDQFVILVLHEPIFASFRADSASAQRLVGKKRQPAVAADPELAQTLGLDSGDAVSGGAEPVAMRAFDGQRHGGTKVAGGNGVFDRFGLDGIVTCLPRLGGVDLGRGVKNHALGNGRWQGRGVA
ncbi:MAG: hypothetical protein RL346_2105 [Verrucomicrobiota bacterium]